MLNKYVALAILVALSAPISAVEEGATPAPIEVGVSVTATKFYARNYSSTPQVLLFQSGSTMIWRTLAPYSDSLAREGLAFLRTLLPLHPTHAVH